MAINQLIAAGIQQPRFESPLNMMAQLSQLEAAREANALRQVQMQRLQRQEQQENELGALLASGAPLTVQTLGRFGKLGYDALAAQRQADLVARQLEEKDAAKQEKQRMAVAQALHSTLGDPSRENFDNTFRFLKEQGLTKGIEPIFAEMMMQTPEQRRQSVISFANAVPGMQKYFQDLDKQRAEVEAKRAEALYKGAQARELGMKMAGTLPETPTADLQNYREAVRQGFTGSFMDYKRDLRPQGTTIQMPPGESAFSQAVGAGLGKEAVAEVAAARAARPAAERANRVLQAVSENKAFMGTAADFKLQLARALNISGRNASEIIAATETLVADLKQSVIDAIRSSNLGTGNGFTNKDLDYLVSAKAADIAKDPKTLAEFARRAYLTSEEAVKRGNKRLENPQIRSQAGVDRFELPPLFTTPRGSVGAEAPARSGVKFLGFEPPER